MPKSSLITVGLSVLCLGLGWYVYDEVRRPVPSSAVKGQPATFQKIEAIGNPGNRQSVAILPPIEAFGEIVSRPLFNISRRPIAVAEPVAETEATELKVMLSGIVIGQAQQIAHLRSIVDKRTRALGVGDKIDDWQIESIFPDRVVLRSGGRVETLFMQKPGVHKTVAPGRGASSTKANSRRAKSRSQRRLRQNSRRNRSRRDQ
jgi:type II secretory pathway component PulC